MKSTTPGPGQYDESKTSKKSGFTFGGRPKTSKFDENPGPGAYEQT